MKKCIYFVCVIASMISCVSKTKYENAIATIDSLNIENQKLLLENEELINGEERLINYINMHYDKKEFIKAEEKIANLQLKHPESRFLANNQELFTIIHQKAKHQKDSIEKHIKDSIRLANINELGDWKIGYYVDDFDNPTGEHYVYMRINGHFSNSATSSSKLSVYLQISKNSYKASCYSYRLSYDEYDDGVKERYYDLYRSKFTKKENNKIIMIGNCSLEYGDCYYKYPDGTEGKYDGIIEMLKDEGVYYFEVTAENNSYSADTKYYFGIDSRYLNNALLKAGIDEL